MTDDLRHRSYDEAATPPAASGGQSATLVAQESARAGDDDLAREGLRIEARSQWQLFRRKFFRHKAAMVALVILTVIFGAAIFAERVAPYAYDEIDLLNSGTAPTLEGQHYFGTDKIGRDYFSRVVYGTRTSVKVALIVAALSTLIGTTIGAVSGYYGGWIDNALMRFTDLMLTLPALPVLLVAAALLGSGNPVRVGVILALLLWTSLARIVRGQFLSLREKEFVEAAKASGASDSRIIFRHILPNALSPIIVNTTLIIGTAILIEAVLSFLGFGVQPPDPALGTLIDDGRNAMLTDWWLVTMPGLTIVFICLCINFLGDGLRDALDPRQQG
ncbi:MAG: ABC transporter permease [Egibacteraceae bacterium]